MKVFQLIFYFYVICFLVSCPSMVIDNFLLDRIAFSCNVSVLKIYDCSWSYWDHAHLSGKPISSQNTWQLLIFTQGCLRAASFMKKAFQKHENNKDPNVCRDSLLLEQVNPASRHHSLISPDESPMETLFSFEPSRRAYLSFLVWSAKPIGEDSEICIGGDLGMAVVEKSSRGSSYSFNRTVSFNSGCCTAFFSLMFTAPKCSQM